MMAGAAVDRVCRLSLERMTREGYHDDISLIAAQRITPAPGFRAEVAAQTGVLAGLRDDLSRWLDTLGASERDVQAIQLAVGEAMTNAVEHAYPAGQPGTVLVDGYHDVSGRACLTVSDRGRIADHWRH